MIIHTTQTGIQIGIHYVPPGPTMDADGYRLQRALVAKRRVLHLGRLRIKASGWPWQTVDNHWSARTDKTVGEKWGWNPFRVKGAGRFGGWWAFKFGVTVSQSFHDIVVDLGIGSLRFTIVREGAA